MNKLIIPFLLAIGCVASTPATRARLAAADLDPAKVPADAKWLLHVDFEQLLETKLAEQLREARPQVVQGIRSWLENELGVHPREDLQAATMYSRNYKSYTGTVILQVNYDRQKLEARLRENPTLKTTEWNGQTLYTITLALHRHDGERDPEHDRSGGKQMTIAMKDGNTLVLASSVENAKETLQLLSGSGKSLQGSDSPLLSAATDAAIFYGAAIDLEQVKESNAFLPVLQQHERVTLVIGERDGQAFNDATFVASSEQVAQQMEQVLQGVLAYKQLWAADSEALSKLFESSTVSREGDQVRVQWQGQSGDVLAGLKDLKQRLGTHKQQGRKAHPERTE